MGQVSEPRRTPVYLRPEQNIPELFRNSAAINFKPIVEDTDLHACGGNNQEGKGHAGASATTAGSDPTQASLTRDDIVVTMRSVNV